MDSQEKIEIFYTELEEPLRGTFLYLRGHLLNVHPQINESWKYGLPFFCFGKKMFCYLWFDKKKNNQPYISFADGYRMQHPYLEQQDRKRFKIFSFDPNKDLDVDTLNEILEEALSFYI